MSVIAYADDLMLVGRNREDLQQTMDMAATWFEMAGVQVNTAKTVLIEWPQGQEQEHLLQWQQGSTVEPITHIVTVNEPVRILGQYVTPGGNVAALATYFREQAEELVQPLARKWLTDRQAQYLYCAVLIPIMAYRTQCTLLNSKEIEHIQAPLLQFVKHKFGVPSTSLSAYWFAQKGGQMPCLQAEVDRRAVDMTVQMLSGKGCQEASTLAQRLEQRARLQLQFPGEMLAHPQLVADRNMPVGRQHIWWLYVAKILVGRGWRLGYQLLNFSCESYPSLIQLNHH
ncbi:hypothetical protein GGH96_003248 [Coemansia sp. RSA 1972]|nr:hypothetical protein GGH96_003248 [Coemansia sp. RSA 1972]